MYTYRNKEEGMLKTCPLLYIYKYQGFFVT